MVLNRNPDNFFAEVEQAAFAPGSAVPGIYYSPDKLLQGRLFSYEDAQRYRLEVNNRSIPENQPKNAQAYSNQRDGQMRVDGNHGGAGNYFPNSVDGHIEYQGIPDVLLKAIGEAMMVRHEPEVVDDDFFQIGEFWRRVLSDSQKDYLVSNIVGHLGNALPRVQYCQASLFYRTEPEYGERVSTGLGLDIAFVKKLSAMSKKDRAEATARDDQMPKPGKACLLKALGDDDNHNDSNLLRAEKRGAAEGRGDDQARGE